MGAFALVAVANAALHRGNSEAAVSLAERAIDRMRAANMMLTEPSLIKAMALIQAGRIDEADQQMASLGDQSLLLRHSTVTAALLAAVNGQPQRASELANEVVDASSTAYFDRILAYVIIATGEAQNDDALGNARRMADEIGDVVAQAIVAAVANQEPTELSNGWATVVRLLG